MDNTPGGGTAEVDANTMEDASGTLEEAPLTPEYNDELDDVALQGAHLTAEDRNVKRLSITTSAVIETKTLFMGGLQRLFRIDGVNERTERLATHGRRDACTQRHPTSPRDWWTPHRGASASLREMADCRTQPSSRAL